MRSLLTLKKNYWVLVVYLLVAVCKIHAGVSTTLPADTMPQRMPSCEYSSVIRTKMATTAFPVQLQVQGRLLCVKSKYNQVLPVYNSGGIFYGVFRLSKGTNWINGLPKGSYFINNKKITIS